MMESVQESGLRLALVTQLTIGVYLYRAKVS